MENIERSNDGNTEDQGMCREEILPYADQGTTGRMSTAGLDDVGNDERSKTTDDDGSDNCSDIDDGEMNEYLHSENEKPWKKELWEAANWEYLEEQAAKEAAAAALKEAQEANLENCSPEARERYAAVLAAMEKSKKEKQQKRAADAKNTAPAQSAVESVHRMLTKKRLSSKINYDVLEKLFEEPSTNGAKKPRCESHSEDDEDEDTVLHTPSKDARLNEEDDDDDLGTIEEVDDSNNNNGYDEHEEQDSEAELDDYDDF